MARYVPTAAQQASIEALTRVGYTVLRTRSYNALHERIRIAEVRADMERERRESCERWAYGCLAEERRLTYRLNAVCTGAAALGVSITAINEALDATTDKDS